MTSAHRHFSAIFGISVMSLAAIAASYAGEEELASTDIAASSAEAFVADHIQIGTRITYFSLLKTKKNTFLGSIDQLKEEQDLIPWKFYADWACSPSCGIELTWDSIRAETRTVKGDNHSDGDFVLTGPILQVLGRYPNSTRWTPVGGIGVAFMKGSFESATWWHTGFPSEEDWRDNGSPSTTLNGLTRNMDLNNPLGAVLSAGCNCRIRDHLVLDCFLRYMNISVKDHYSLSHNGTVIDDRGVTKIPLSNMALGVGFAYGF